MTRLVEINRPLVYGDIVAYTILGDLSHTKDRNLYLGPDPTDRHLHQVIELCSPTGEWRNRGVESFPILRGDSCWRLVEE